MKEKLNEVIAAPPRITVLGRESVKIENADGIATFTETGISVRIKGGLVLAEGDSLVIASMQEGEVVLQGKINSISFA